MENEELRQGVYDAPDDIWPIATPFWPKNDGKIGIGDLSTDELEICQKLSGTPEYGATLLCYSLVDRVTGERFLGKYSDRGVFMPTDRDKLKGKTRILAQIVPQIRAYLSGTVQEKKDTSSQTKDEKTSSGID